MNLGAVIPMRIIQLEEVEQNLSCIQLKRSMISHWPWKAFKSISTRCSGYLIDIIALDSLLVSHGKVCAIANTSCHTQINALGQGEVNTETVPRKQPKQISMVYRICSVDWVWTLGEQLLILQVGLILRLGILLIIALLSALETKNGFGPSVWWSD